MSTDDDLSRAARVQRVHGEQLEFVDIYAEQVRRWRAEGPPATQRRELDRLEQQNRRLRQVTTEVLALAAELRKGPSRNPTAPPLTRPSTLRPIR
jgi:hypothetical protein